MNTIQKFIMKFRTISLKKIIFAKKQIKQFHNIRNQLMQRLQQVNVEQTKYYNVNYKSKKYVVSNLILLSTKNFK